MLGYAVCALDMYAIIRGIHIRSSRLFSTLATRRCFLASEDSQSNSCSPKAFPVAGLDALQWPSPQFNCTNDRSAGLA